MRESSRAARHLLPRAVCFLCTGDQTPWLLLPQTHAYFASMFGVVSVRGAPSRRVFGNVVSGPKPVRAPSPPRLLIARSWVSNALRACVLRFKCGVLRYSAARCRLPGRVRCAGARFDANDTATRTARCTDACPDASRVRATPRRLPIRALPPFVAASLRWCEARSGVTAVAARERSALQTKRKHTREENRGEAVGHPSKEGKGKVGPVGQR